MQHFFVKSDLGKEFFVLDEREIVHQMRKVMRFRPGDEVVLLDNDGTKAFCEIEKFEEERILLKILKRVREVKAKAILRLYCALTKKQETFEIIAQKATELGVDAIVPLVTERCQLKSLRKPERILKIIREAAEQCERFFLPKFEEVLEFKKLIAAPPSGILLVGDARKFDKNLKKIEVTEKDVNLIIGPEGGLTDKELLELKNAGAIIFGMGENVLRTETAAIAALAILKLK